MTTRPPYEKFFSAKVRPSPFPIPAENSTSAVLAPKIRNVGSHILKMSRNSWPSYVWSRK